MKSSHLLPTKLTTLAALVLLSACTVGPDFETPTASPSQHYDQQAEQRLGQGGSQRIALGNKVRGQWWSALGSPKLDQVMRRAIDGNLELVAADATIRQAAQSVAAAQGALYPQVDFGATAGRQRVHNAKEPSITNFYAIGPRVGFDLDVFGGNKRLIEQQQAFTDLQTHRYEAAYLTLTGEVASQALLVASANAQMQAVETLLDNDVRNLELVRAAHVNGTTTQIDVSLAETRLAQDRTLLPPLAQQRDAARHALSILTGKGPADWIAPDFHLDEFALPSNVPVSLPSEMAHDRPDVRQAAVEGYNATLAGYQQTVISSFGQVADTLQAINHDAQAYRAQEDALQAADSSLRLNRQAFAQGENGILQVLEAERAYQQALLGQVRVKTAQYLDTVQLFVALGGNSVGVFEQQVASRETARRSYQ